MTRWTRAWASCAHVLCLTLLTFGAAAQGQTQLLFLTGNTSVANASLVEALQIQLADPDVELASRGIPHDADAELVARGLLSADAAQMAFWLTRLDADTHELHWASLRDDAVARGSTRISGRAGPALERTIALKVREALETRQPPQPVAAAPGKEWTIGPARVRVQSEMLLSWQEETSTLRLGEAAAVIAIEATSPARSVRVVARNYIVEVSAAQFEIAPSVVTMMLGTARVLAPDGGVVLAELAPGQAWSAAAKPPATARRQRAARQRDVSAELRAAQQRDVSAELRAARGLLAQRKLAEGERAIATALRTRPTRPQRAEALSLRAEAALMAGDEARAQALYLQVADEYRELDASDNALFAAARLAQRRGQGAETRRLLQRYLEHYPNGRFRTDAQRRLTDTPAR